MKAGRGEITIEEIVGTYSGCCQELKTRLSPKNGVLEASGLVGSEKESRRSSQPFVIVLG